MSIQIEHVGEVAVVTPAGIFKGGKETDELQAVLTKLIIEEGQSTLLDMSRVDLMSSIAVGVVIVAHTQAEERGVDFALCGIQPRIESVLQITRFFGPRLRVFEQSDQALKALQEV